jgi:hypothetical protein
MAKIGEPPLLELREAAEIGANEAPIYDESGTVDPDLPELRPLEIMKWQVTMSISS